LQEIVNFGCPSLAGTQLPGMLHNLVNLDEISNVLQSDVGELDSERSFDSDVSHLRSWSKASTAVCELVSLRVKEMIKLYPEWLWSVSPTVHYCSTSQRNCKRGFPPRGSRHLN
jgi:hypothetical protein